ncbi:MAG: universal stress protein [Thermodesulfobacteriota bacterium]
MYRTILFATTATPSCDNAAKVAFDLANKYSARLIVLHVLGQPTRGYSQVAVDYRTGQEVSVDPDYIEWVREELRNTYAKQLAEAKGEVDLTVKIGMPCTEILRLARQEKADLVVMGANTRSEETAASRFRDIVGRTLRKVAKSSRAPVLIVARPCSTCFWYFSNIVLATDFSKASLSAFLYAQKLAKTIGCRLHFFHCVELPQGAAVDQKRIEEKVAEARARMEESYIKQLDDFDNYDLEVREGTPHVEILKFAREKSGDLIVMAHHTRDVPEDEAEIGGTVEQVVLRSACPVASVNRPDRLE